MEPKAEGESLSGQNQLRKILGRTGLRNVAVPLLLSLILFLLFNVFFFEFFKVNQADMEDSYFSGDLVLLRKWPLQPERLGVYQIQFPHKDERQHKTRFIQRLMAMPGDCLKIMDKQVWVNGVADTFRHSLKHNYFVKTKNFEPDEAFRSRYGIREGGKVSAGFDFSYSLTENNLRALEKDSLVLEVKAKREKAGMFDPDCFPGSVDFAWNTEYYGSIYIPKAGDTLKLDRKTLALYSNIIGDYEGNSIQQNGDSIFINQQFSSLYVVRQNYYFFMGDNRDNAVDSRHFGYFPESAIRAKLILRCYSAAP